MLGDQVGQQVSLGTVVDDQSVAELVGQSDRSGDVVHSMHVLPPGQLAVENLRQYLQGEITVDGSVPVAAYVSNSVILGLHKCVSQYGRHAETGRGQLVQIAVNAFRVLPECALHRHRLAHHHVVDGAAVTLDDDDLTTDGIGGAPA
jgi:hypothetical protein